MGWKTKFHHGPFGTLNAIRAAQPRLPASSRSTPCCPGSRRVPELRAAIRELIGKAGA